MDSKEISKAIRMRKKSLLRPDMDYAGQEALDPNALDDIVQNERVSKILDSPDHPKPSEEMMGEGESTQSLKDRKKISARIASYFKTL